MSLFIASYDISDNRRRRRVARVLSGFGSRIQKSVFQIHVDPDELEDLQFEVAIHLEASDEFALLPIDDRGTRTSISWQRPLAGLPAVIVL